MEWKTRFRSLRRFGFLAASAVVALGLLVGPPPCSAAQADQDPTLEALQARVDRAVHELERLRERKLKRPVPVKLQTEAAFRAYVDRELARQLPDDLAVRESLALQAFGLLPPGYDLKEGIKALYVSQAGAYYDPETDTFYVLKTNLPDEQLDTLLLHELAHAMQDQYFDLEAMRQKALENPNEDTRATLAYVYEGEASYLMMLAQLLQGGKAYEDVPLVQQEMVFQSMRDLSREALLKNAVGNQPAGEQGDDVHKAVEALSNVPDYMFWALQDPYLKGQYCIHRVRAAQGWAGVDALFERPPTSTEQVLHPEKLVEPREEPTVVALPDFSSVLAAEWKEVFRNTLGEAGTATFLETHHATARRTGAAAGWGGDSYAVFQHPAQGLLLFWHTVWDRESGAEAFARALRSIKSDELCAGRPGTQVMVKKSGTSVFLLAGPPDAVGTLRTAMGPGSQAP